MPRRANQLTLWTGAVIATFMSCAHASPEAPACTPDPAYTGYLIACGDVDDTGKRLCGIIVGKCILYVMRDTCAAQWVAHSEVCTEEP